MISRWRWQDLAGLGLTTCGHGAADRYSSADDLRCQALGHLADGRAVMRFSLATITLPALVDGCRSARFRRAVARAHLVELDALRSVKVSNSKKVEDLLRASCRAP